jgi:hypothetical protein
MAQTRFTCTLTRVDEPAGQSYAQVTIRDSESATAHGYPRHAVAALDGSTGAPMWTGPTRRAQPVGGQGP